MLVKEIIINASTLINRQDVVNYLKDEDANPSQITLDTVEVLVRLLNMVVSELASSFVPMIVSEDCTANYGKVEYSSLSFRPKEILKVFNNSGEDSLLSVERTFVRVKDALVKVEYSCFPNEFTIDDSIAYSQSDVSKNTLTHGLLAEYAISQGCFKDAVMWHDRFADAINQLIKPKNGLAKRRAWL